MTYNEFEALILHEYPQTDPAYLITLINRIVQHLNTLTKGIIIEEKAISFNPPSAATVATGYYWSSATNMLTIPTALTELISVNHKLTSDNRTKEIKSFDWQRYYDLEQEYAVYHSMGRTGMKLSTYISSYAGEVWIKARKQVTLTAIGTPTAVITVPDNWLTVLEAGVLVELSQGTDMYKSKLISYRDLLGTLVETESQFDVTDESAQAYNYNTGLGATDNSERPDDGVHHWWS